MFSNQMALVLVLVCHISVNFENPLFVSRLLDFTSAVGYEQVDLDTCLLSERPPLAVPGVDDKLLPQPQPLPSPVRGTFFPFISQAQSEKECSPEGLKTGASVPGSGKLTGHTGPVTQREDVGTI